MGLLFPDALEGCAIIFLPTLFVSLIFLIDFPFEFAFKGLVKLFDLLLLTGI